MINMGELFAYPRIMNPEMARVQPSENEISRYAVEKDDLLFARRSLVLEGAGKCAIVAELEYPTVFESSIIRVRLNKELCDPVFYFYFFRSQAGFGFIQQIVNQVAVSGIRGSDLERMKIIYPPFPIQQKIAAILSAYDNLIENNNKRIILLEKAAEEIYREWFVRMRFAGWETVKFVKGVPEGWEVGSYTNYIDVMSGGTPKTDVPQYWGDDIPWFTPRDLHDSFFISDTERRITEDGLRHCASKLYPPNTVFITARGTVGNCVMNVVPMALSQTSYALLGKNNLPQYFVYYLTLSMVASLKQQATGAVFDTIIVDTFRKQTVLIPTKKILEKYISIVAPMLEQLKILQKQNEKLKQSRDLLLSRLISGKLSVDGLDVRMPMSISADGGVERG